VTAQLTLPVSLFDGPCFDNFHAPESNDTVTAVRDIASSSTAGRAMFLSGAAGSGKSHLCWAACRLSSEVGNAPTYVPLRRPGVAHTLLSGVPESGLVCLDDIDAVADDSDWNQRLFSLLEHHYLQGKVRLIVTARQPAAELEFKLADLLSRLKLLAGFRVQSLNDAEKINALQSRAQRRGMQIDVEVVDYIMSRFSRDTHALFAFLDRIDVDSISRQRKITIPFVRSVLGQTA